MGICPICKKIKRNCNNMFIDKYIISEYIFNYIHTYKKIYKSLTIKFYTKNNHN